MTYFKSILLIAFMILSFSQSYAGTLLRAVFKDGRTQDIEISDGLKMELDGELSLHDAQGKEVCALCDVHRLEYLANGSNMDLSDCSYPKIRLSGGAIIISLHGRNSAEIFDIKGNLPISCPFDEEIELSCDAFSGQIVVLSVNGVHTIKIKL